MSTYDSDYCDCPVCSSAENRMTKYSYNKYGMHHHGACMCQKCLRLYEAHNRTKLCLCDDCRTHRHYVYKPVEQKQKQKQKQKGRARKVAVVAICDVCETFAKSEVLGSIVLQRWEYDEEPIVKQVCPGCVGDLVAVMDPKQDRVRPSAYKTRWEPSKSDQETLADVTTERLAKELLGRAYPQDSTND